MCFDLTVGGFDDVLGVPINSTVDNNKANDKPADKGNKASDFTMAAAVNEAMMAFKSDEGRPLGIMPNLLVVGPTNRAAAKTVIEVEKNAAGADNINYKAVDILVVPWLT